MRRFGPRKELTHLVRPGKRSSVDNDGSLRIRFQDLFRYKKDDLHAEVILFAGMIRCLPGKQPRANVVLVEHQCMQAFLELCGNGALAGPGQPGHGKQQPGANGARRDGVVISSVPD
jgi:hypothetical protein